MKTRKKLIEVALPLEAINKESAREKSIRHGHPSTLHLWWARRPLASARAVIFAQMVDDPSSCPDLFPTEKAQQKERKRLFGIIEKLVKWENTTNEEVLNQARDEIWQSWRRACADNADHPQADELFDRHKLPAFHDPFAGGGALPLEAQRLGLEAYASDLNPVAVLINKAMIEIPPKFAGKRPINPEARSQIDWGTRDWKGAEGLAEDVRYYGKWMRDEAQKRIGYLYPSVEITPEMIAERPDLGMYKGKSITVIAWIWARTVKSPNPAFADVDVPLASTFMLSTKPGKEAYVEPVIEGGNYRFTVRVGKPKDDALAQNGTKLSRGANFRCLMSDIPIAPQYIKSEGIAGRMGSMLMAIVVEGARGRIYLSPTPEQEKIARSAAPVWKPEGEIAPDKRSMFTPLYGLTHFHHLFTPRQLVALTTFSDLVSEAREKIERDAWDAQRENHHGDTILGTRTSGPHEAPRSPEKMRAGGPRTQGLHPTILLDSHPLGTRTSGPHEAPQHPTTTPKPASETAYLRAPTPRPEKGWYSRGYHPHIDLSGLVQSVTFRLGDSVPDEVVQQWRNELGLLDKAVVDEENDDRRAKLREYIDRYEDAGHGACWLSDPRIAQLVEDALLHFDGQRYHLLEWCIMPNHVHVLLETAPGHPLSDVVRSWKTFTAREANSLLGRTGVFWMEDYFDRFVRDERHYEAVRLYIWDNPVKAHLCRTQEEWRWSSVWSGWRERSDGGVVPLRGMRAGGPRTQCAR